MAQTLDAPVYEINPESVFYKQKFAEREQDIKISKVIDELAEELGFNAEEFLYYGPFGFGFFSSNADYKLFKEHLTKNPDRSGVYRFKKSSKLYKIISTRLLEVEGDAKGSPFAAHDVFGINNVSALQWLGDRLFYQAKDEKAVEIKLNGEKRCVDYPVEPLIKFHHTDYLKLYLERAEK